MLYMTSVEKIPQRGKKMETKQFAFADGQLTQVISESILGSSRGSMYLMDQIWEVSFLRTNFPVNFLNFRI